MSMIPMEDAAQLVAKMAHKGQKYGQHPYTFHLAMTVQVLYHHRLFGVYAAAGWLHDVLEDTDMRREELAMAFGQEVSRIVWAVTGEGRNRKERNQSIYRKMRMVPGAGTVKLADRIANVHWSLVTQDDRFEMYLKEDAEFTKAVDEIAVPWSMWQHYRSMMDERQTLDFHAAQVRSNGNQV